MAKAEAVTGEAGVPIHTRTTAGDEESQAMVIGIDGSDAVVPAGPLGLVVDQSDPGTWGYRSGTSGTPTLTGRRVLALACVAGGSGATVTINGGDAITVDADRAFEIAFRGRLTAPTIVFTGTARYFVETAS